MKMEGGYHGSYEMAEVSLVPMPKERGDLNEPNSLPVDKSFPNSVLELILPFYHIFSNGGIGKGGLNFDAKIRRQSIDPEDLFYAHIGGMDICAKTLLAVEKMINDKKLSDYVTKRYEDWQKDLGNYIYNKGTTLESIHQKVLDENIEPKPRSGNQEYLENILNKYL